MGQLLLYSTSSQSSPGKFIYDPFAGTGSMLYVRCYSFSHLWVPLMPLFKTTAHFGAMVFGSDIDGRQMRGKGAYGPRLSHHQRLC